MKFLIIACLIYVVEGKAATHCQYITHLAEVKNVPRRAAEVGGTLNIDAEMINNVLTTGTYTLTIQFGELLTIWATGLYNSPKVNGASDLWSDFLAK